MVGKKYYFVIRHGPTNKDKDESINFDKYLKIITKLILFVKEFLDKKGIDINKNIVIHASPIDRCQTTAKFISTYLNVLNGNEKLKIITDKNVQRWNRKEETLDGCFARAQSYGNKLFNEQDDDIDVHFIITHSSVINALVAGLCGVAFQKNKLRTSSLSIINGETRELEVFNKSFKSKKNKLPESC
jgi:phosphohistidine phosphatase SixA